MYLHKVLKTLNGYSIIKALCKCEFFSFSVKQLL